MPYLIDRIKQLERDKEELSKAVYYGSTVKSLPEWVLSMPLSEYDAILCDALEVIKELEGESARYRHLEKRRKLALDMMSR